MSLLPDAEGVNKYMDLPGVSTVSPVAFSAYDLPSVEALVRYFHAAAGYPIKYWYSLRTHVSMSFTFALSLYLNCTQMILVDYWYNLEAAINT